MKLVFIIVMAVALAGFASAFNPPHYSQRDPRWGNHKLGFASYTIGQEGCFLTCQTSMIASQGIKVNGQIPDPDSLNTWYKNNGGFLNGGGMLNYKAPEKFGFKYEKMTSQSSAVAAFNQGKFVLCHVEHLSHWVLVTSVDSNGYQVMDPADVKTSYKFSEVPEYAVYTAPAGYPGTSSSAADEAEEPTPEPVSTPVPESTPEPQPTGFNPPVYRQGDSRWGKKQLGFGSYTIARKGCFLTAQTSMIASQGITINNGQIPDPDNMNEWFKDNDQFDGGMLLYKAPEEFGFTYEGKSSSRSSVIDAFNEGKFVLLHVENLSHWVLVTSITSTGYQVMDPADVRTSYKFSEVPEVAIYTAPPGKPGTA